jgi:hypothetical protein
MALDKASMSKWATGFGYGVYALTVVLGVYLIIGDPIALTSTKPSFVQIGGLMLICYGIVEVAVTYYNRLPPMKPRSKEQVAVDKSKMRERNDAKSKDLNVGKQK